MVVEALVAIVVGSNVNAVYLIEKKTVHSPINLYLGDVNQTLTKSGTRKRAAVGARNNLRMQNWVILCVATHPVGEVIRVHLVLKDDRSRQTTNERNAF